jgi:hypothetical protein
MKHWIKVIAVIVAFLIYFTIFGLVFGFHRLSTEFIPLDASSIGSSIYASFIWLPIAFVGGWIISDVRNERNLERQRALFEDHAKKIDEKLEANHLKMAKLLGVDDQVTSDAVGATPSDRSFDDSSTPKSQ